MEKLKVSQEIYDALKEVQTHYYNDSIIKLHVNTKSDEYPEWSGTWTCLNELSVMEMAQALTLGFETDLTPEQKLYKKYQVADTNISQTNSLYWSGVIDGIRITLETLNIKVDGIN